MEAISAVEGMETDLALKGMFEEFDRKKLSPEEQRDAIRRRFAVSS